MKITRHGDPVYALAPAQIEALETLAIVYGWSFEHVVALALQRGIEALKEREEP